MPQLSAAIGGREGVTRELIGRAEHTVYNYFETSMLEGLGAAPKGLPDF